MPAAQSVAAAGHEVMVRPRLPVQRAAGRMPHGRMTIVPSAAPSVGGEALFEVAAPADGCRRLAAVRHVRGNFVVSWVNRNVRLLATLHTARHDTMTQTRKQTRSGHAQTDARAWLVALAPLA